MKWSFCTELHSACNNMSCVYGKDCSGVFLVALERCLPFVLQIDKYLNGATQMGKFGEHFVQRVGWRAVFKWDDDNGQLPGCKLSSFQLQNY